MVVRCDALFDEFNTNKKINNPIEKCCSYILAKEKNYPLKVVKLFCKVKLFSRIRQLNEKRKNLEKMCKELQANSTICKLNFFLNKLLLIIRCFCIWQSLEIFVNDWALLKLFALFALTSIIGTYPPSFFHFFC